jgi:hypothetical protein
MQGQRSSAVLFCAKITGIYENYILKQSIRK